MIKNEEKIAFKGKYYYALGKRKTSQASVRIYPKGQGRIFVNNFVADNYFRTKELQAVALSPLREVEGSAKFDLSIKVSGGGQQGQAEAIRHGVAKAAVEMERSLKPALKKLGYITRDARKKERKKPGLKKARRAPQWAKR